MTCDAVIGVYMHTVLHMLQYAKIVRSNANEIDCTSTSQFTIFAYWRMRKAKGENTDMQENPQYHRFLAIVHWISGVLSQGCRACA